MRFSILVIVKEDDGSTLRGDNKKMVSSLRIPVGIDSSFFGAFEIGKCKMLFRGWFLLQFEFSRERFSAFELSRRIVLAAGRPQLTKKLIASR
jgi:hypothetical protein